VSGQPLVFIDPKGLERYGRPKYNSNDPDRTAPLPLDMEWKATRLELCMNVDLIITGGAEQGRHDCPDSRHYSGNAVDFGFNSNPRIKQRSNDFFCCALKCG